jgi:hypothetical protein
VTGRAKAAAGLAAGIGLTLAVGSVAGRAPWQDTCSPVAGSSSAALVQAGSGAGTVVLPQPPDTEVVCK